MGKKKENKKNITTKDEKQLSWIVKLKSWALEESFRPMLFSSNCCQTLEEFVESDFFGLKAIHSTDAELNEPNLFIVHGPVNEKKAQQIKEIYSKTSSKRKILVGVGTCLTKMEYTNQVDITSQLEFDFIVPGCQITGETLIESIKEVWGKHD